MLFNLKAIAVIFRVSFYINHMIIIGYIYILYTHLPGVALRHNAGWQESYSKKYSLRISGLVLIIEYGLMLILNN